MQNKDVINSFPGYVYDSGKSIYKGIEVGEGGYVYAEPGMYKNVALLDINSAHPNSLINMNLFGTDYTKKFKELLDARLAIKHKDFETAGKMFNGKLKKYLTNPEDSKQLAYALKIVINSVYGYTSARFENKFKDPRNKDNIVAKRGALFMIDLNEAVRKEGYKIIHIKTDSVKIPEADNKIINFVMEFGKKYGYTFEHEATYDKICLVNDAVYIAHHVSKDFCKNAYGYIPEDNEKYENEWTATGTEFQRPYVFKSLFSKEKLEFKDFCEIKTVKDSMYLDFNEGDENNHKYSFIGKAGMFCPVKPGANGGLLVVKRNGKDKYDAVTGTKGYRWQESAILKELHKEDDLDMEYFKNMANDSIKTIEQFGDFEAFRAVS